MHASLNVHLREEDQIRISPQAVTVQSSGPGSGLSPSLTIFPDDSLDRLTELRDAIDIFIDSHRLTELNELDIYAEEPHDPALEPF